MRSLATVQCLTLKTRVGFRHLHNPVGEIVEEDEEEGRTELMMAAVLKYIQMKHKLSESDSMFSSLSLSLCFNLYIDRYGMCSLMHTLFSIYDCLFENW